MRMKDKVGIVVDAGQTPSETIGNGRAAAILTSATDRVCLSPSTDREIN